jgi:hypothetical protein
MMQVKTPRPDHPTPPGARQPRPPRWPCWPAWCCCIWLRELWLAPTGRGTLLVLTVPPLLLCVRGMRLHRMYTFRWLSLLIWLYVALASLRATTETGLPRTLAVLELLLCGAAVHDLRALHPAPAAQCGAAGGNACASCTGDCAFMNNTAGRLQAAVGASPCADEGDRSAWEVDWRRRWRGKALAVVRPCSTEEVAAVMRLCAQHGTAVVPQGGNTGLVGGGVPDDSGTQVLLSLQRLNRVREIDAANLTLTAEAGCVLQALARGRAAPRACCCR